MARTFNEEEWCDKSRSYGHNAFDYEDLAAVNIHSIDAPASLTQRQPWLYIPSPTLMSDSAYANCCLLINFVRAAGLFDVQ